MSVKYSKMKYTCIVFIIIKSEVTQSCLILCDPMVCSPPGSSVHGIFQAWILEWVAISFSNDKVRSEWSEVVHLCLTLGNPRDCSLPGSSVHGIFQARGLEWVAISFSAYKAYSVKTIKVWSLIQEVNSKKISLNIWKLSYKVLNNSWIKKEIPKEIRKYFELNDNGSKIQQDL